MTIVETRVTHDWRLVAPWWHWPTMAKVASGDISAAGAREAVRNGAPVLQKYDSPDFVNTFLADPQQRLAFVPDSDQIATVPDPPNFTRVPERTLTSLRKVFLPTHHRNYLVLTSLHCDTTGFPRVDRDATCEAGFVVRRRTLEVPAEAKLDALNATRALSRATRRRLTMEAQLATAAKAGAGALRLTALTGRVTAARNEEHTAREALRTWAATAGLDRTLEGWIPHGLDAEEQAVPLPGCSPSGGNGVSALKGVGAWLAVAEMPEGLAEATFPMYPLVADPTKPAHDASGETIWFGVLPASSTDIDLEARARFDDRSTYEIRCFVRRHRPECPRDGGHCTCPITWSAPTEPYRLASHFDLEGTGNRPVTVQMPDLGQLHADAIRLSPGRGMGVRFEHPPGSALRPITTNSPLGATGAPKNPTFQICSFSIPLITIIAMFVLQIFLPIVVFVFQLWWMLLLKFCIPPEVSVGGGAALDLALEGLKAPMVELGVGLDIDLGTAGKLFGAGEHASKVNTALNALLGGFKTAPTGGKSMSTLVRDQVANGTIDAKSFAAIVRGVVQAAEPPPPPDRVFAPRVRRDEVVTP